MTRRIATNSSVDRDGLLEFVRSRHRVVLMTTRREGTPQASPVTAGMDEQGRLVVATYPERSKVANARREPAGAALILSKDWNGEWVQIWGTFEVLDLPDALEPLIDYFRAISGEHPDWDEYRQAMVDQGKSLLRLTIDRWGSDGYRRLPGPARRTPTRVEPVVGGERPLAIGSPRPGGATLEELDNRAS
jgi:PPOX class probable F420-dependent enzyme